MPTECTLERFEFEAVARTPARAAVTVDALASAMATASARAGLNAKLGLRLVDNFAVGRLSAMALVPITATAANLPP